ncbi:hypothetical protein GF319_05750 [Candidatus Bathyarchaeota archaeon]|nr:hypothetical protein [Candidatus Bathyarchaeota archaeon]
MTERMPFTDHKNLGEMILSKLSETVMEDLFIDVERLAVKTADEYVNFKDKSLKEVEAAALTWGSLPESFREDYLEVFESVDMIRLYRGAFYENLDELQREGLIRIIRVAESSQEYVGQKFITLTRLGREHVRIFSEASE